MRMRKLGSSGLFVSELCFGAMTFGGAEGLWGKVGRLGQEEADGLVKAALDAGISRASRPERTLVRCRRADIATRRMMDWRISALSVCSHA